LSDRIGLNNLRPKTYHLVKIGPVDPEVTGLKVGPLKYRAYMKYEFVPLDLINGVGIMAPTLRRYSQWKRTKASEWCVIEATILYLLVTQWPTSARLFWAISLCVAWHRATTVDAVARITYDTRRHGSQLLTLDLCWLASTTC